MGASWAFEEGRSAPRNDLESPSDFKPTRSAMQRASSFSSNPREPAIGQQPTVAPGNFPKFHRGIHVLPLASGSHPKVGTGKQAPGGGRPTVRLRRSVQFEIF